MGAFQSERPLTPGGRSFMAFFGFCLYIYRYELSASRRNALSQSQVWQVSRRQMDELRLWDDSNVHRFAGAVVAGASIAGLRGKS